MVLDGGRLIGGDQLGLETGVLPVGAVVFADIESARIDDLLGLVERIGAGVFSFQIGFWASVSPAVCRSNQRSTSSWFCFISTRRPS